MNNKNYRVMKFFEPVNKNDKSRGYVRLDIRGVRGNMIVAAENLGHAKSFSEVYLYKDKDNKIKLGDINNKKGIIKKRLTFGNANAIEDYNVCAVVKDGKIVLYSNLFNTVSPDIVRKLEEDEGNVVEREVETSVKKREERDEDVKETAQMEKDLKEEATEKAVKKELQGEKKESKIKESGEIKERKEYSQDLEAKEEILKVAKKIQLDKSKEKLKKNLDYQGPNRYAKNLYATLSNYQLAEPLSVKLKNFEWWYVPYDDKGMHTGILPYYNQIISSYYPYPVSSRVTTCASLMKKYGHYIFGIYKENDEISKLVYGIPGEFTKEEQPYRGMTGFKNWSYGNKENKEGNGYWLAFVNPKTGEATDPPQVSIT